MNLQDSRAGANGYAIQLTAVDAAGLPSLCELLGGDVQAAWAQACVEILASVCDPTRAFDGKRSIKMTISFVPEPDLQSCQYFIEPLSIEIPAPDVPRGGRMVFRRNDKGMTARLKSGNREAMPELPEVRRINRSSVVEALQLDALGEGYLDMAWRQSLISVLANIDNRDAQMDCKRQIFIKVDFSTDEERGILTPTLHPVRVKLAGVKAPSPVSLFLEDDGREISVVDEPEAFFGDMDHPDSGRQSRIPNDPTAN